MSDQSRVLADSEQLDFRFRVGASLLTEFAVSHTPADVLRELVQNEYDAGGTELAIEFGTDALVVHGNGRIIDKTGWKRLSVMLGTGLIPGADDRVEPKVNGIGSKNFGLRSLFLFGDRIHIMSGGWRTVLDRTEGALFTPLLHPDSRGRPGVTLVIPYRKDDDGPLRTFDEHYEVEALRTIASELAPTLIKLARPGAGKNLRAGVLRSERAGHELLWRQTARADRQVPNLLRRTIRVDERGERLADVPQAISELEYQHVVSPLPGLQKPSIPGYFRVPGGRIRLGISLRTRRGRLELGTAGIFYYPIGVSRSRTGFAFSVSAPFWMTEDRNQLVDPQNSPWNAWLVQEAAAFAVRLLTQRLFPAFGPDSFLAFDVRAANASTTPELSGEIDRLLRSEPCWPTQVTARRPKRPAYALAESLAVPVNGALSDLVAAALDPEILLHADMVARGEARAMAMALGAKAFTVSSLVRLRCAGEDDQDLATTLDKAAEESIWFTDFPGELRDLALQQQFAVALDACRGELGEDHKKDLRKSPTTMTGAETLRSPNTPLWVIDEILAEAVPKDRTLHPCLTRYRVLAGLCKPFYFSSWAIDTANRLREGIASELERDALTSYIRGRPALSDKAWRAVRRSPVLMDHRGEWSAPADMVSRSASGASLLEPALHLVRPADEANESLRRLQFRRTVRGADLVALARLVEQGTVPPAVMRRAVGRLQRLLTPSVLAQLKGIRFLETRLGSLMASTDVYIKSDRVVAVLGEEAPYAIDMPVSLLRRLGCRTDPRADDIVGALAKLRESGGRPSRSEVVYRALVAAFHGERRQAGPLQDQTIIWTGDRWEAPADCLVGIDNRKAFLDAVTVLPEGMRDVWVFLGVPQRPRESHWRRLLVRISELFGPQQPIPRRVVEVLHRAYRHLDGLPEGLSSDTRCLLDDQRCLHTPSEAVAGQFLVNDDPVLAAAALSDGVPVAFADASDRRVLPFLDAAGTRPLSVVAPLTGTDYGPELPPNDLLSVGKTLDRLHNPNFASAVAALASVVSGPDRSLAATGLAIRLARIERIAVVDRIQRRYQVAGHAVIVARDYDVRDDRIVLNRISRSYELRRSVANAVAVIADPGRLGEQVLGDPIYFLLRCRSMQEMQHELEQRKIPWKPDLGPSMDDTDELDDEVMASLADALGHEVIRDAMSRRSSVAETRPAPAPVPPTPTSTPRPPLPDFELVQPQPVAATSRPSSRSSGTRGSGGSGTWTPRSYQQSEDDRAVGRRGEEIVLNIERERVAQLGFSPERVTWTADTVPHADHDIRSVDDDGRELWVEVKSTTGRDGQFSWPVAEFQLAIRERHRYMLYRVYEADTTTPSWIRIRDPIGVFDAGGLRLDLDQLAGDVGPLTGGSQSAAPTGGSTGPG